MFKQAYYRNINTFRPCSQCYFQVTSNLNMSQKGEVFKQRFHRILNIIRLCRPELLSGNLQSEHVARGESVQTTILYER